MALSKFTNLGHDRLAIFTLDVAERHLRALMLVELELGVVQVGNLVEGY